MLSDPTPSHWCHAYADQQRLADAVDAEDWLDARDRAVALAAWAQSAGLPAVERAAHAWIRHHDQGVGKARLRAACSRLESALWLIRPAACRDVLPAATQPFLAEQRMYAGALYGSFAVA